MKSASPARGDSRSYASSRCRRITTYALPDSGWDGIESALGCHRLEACERTLYLRRAFAIRTYFRKKTPLLINPPHIKSPLRMPVRVSNWPESRSNTKSQEQGLQVTH